MGLEDKYDSFYKRKLEKENFTSIELTKWPRNRMEAIIFSIEIMNLRRESVLDVGCGNGQLLFQLKSKFSKLYGLEYSKDRLQQAIINLEGLPFTPFKGSAENLSEIEDCSIDCIVSADTIEHIPDVYKATDEMFRIIKPGGSLIINTPNIASIKKRLLLLFGRFPSTSQANEGLGNDILFDGGHLHYFTFRSLKMLLEKSGFTIEQVIGYGRFGRAQNFYPSLLSGGAQVVAKRPKI